MIKRIKSLYEKWRKKNVLYMNKPISKEKADEIGMNVYVDYLESAINDGADMISVISRFGTGKSSLIELLKSKYRGWKKRNKKYYKRVYCEINLWSQLESNKNKSEEDVSTADQTVELHRAFLYQLIASVYPDKSSYFSRRTSRNFGMFKISGENMFWSVCVTALAILFCSTILVQNYLEEITEKVLLPEVITENIFIGYVVCGVMLLLILVKTEIVFSSKGSEGKRKIEENELVDLYRKYVLVRWNIFRWLKAKIFGAKHIVVVIEDLDRTENGDSVYHFLKELRKYYVPNEQAERNFINKVTFIVNIMPEDLLHEKCSNINAENNYVYDKLFDYSLKLNRINIDNFDVILEALIMEKKKELTSIGIQVNDADNVHDISGMQWIIRGKELSFRQIKERLNDAIVLYESLKNKFDIDYAEFEKCAVVAYLRNAYSKEFYNLSDRELDEMLTWYAKSNKTEEEFVAEYDKEEPKKTEFLKEIYRMIRAHLIDGNYRSYFFNYPKNSHLYTVQEMRVRNLIIYNEQLVPEMEKDLEEVNQNHKEVIIDALQNVVELLGGLPEVVFWSRDLWDISHDSFYKYLDELVFSRFLPIDVLKDDDYRVIDSVVQKKDGIKMLCEPIELNDLHIIISVRDYLLENYLDQIAEYLVLFNKEEAPLTEIELTKMNTVSLEYILEMVKGTVVELDETVIDIICQKILKEKNGQILENAELFYNELVNVKGIDNVVDAVVDYMIARRFILPELSKLIFDAVEAGRIDVEHYYRLLNNVPADQVDGEVLVNIALLDKPTEFNLDICENLKEYGLHKEYLLNMITFHSNKIDLSWEQIKVVMGLHGLEMWNVHSEHFFKIRQWLCEKYKDDVIELEEYFKEPYPLITNDETACLTKTSSIFTVYDKNQAVNDKENVYVNFCNRQFRKGKELFDLFKFITFFDKSVIPEMFYNLDMRKMRFSLLALNKKRIIIELLRVPLKLITSKEIVQFMQFVECTIPELESEILPDLKVKGNVELCKEYIKAVQIYGKVTDETIENIRVMPKIYPYGEVINDALYERGYYRMYVCSKTMELDTFIIEYDKLDILWNEYMSIFRNVEKYSYTCPRMNKNKEFLEMVQNRDEYKDLPEKSRLALATIPQDENTLRDVLNYKDDFVTNYFSKIVGFSSNVAAEEFLRIMNRYPKYAQNKLIYKNVHPKLNGGMKRRYTNLYNAARK